MIGWHWGKPAHRPLRVLYLGAHCDDIEIGCGGSILALIERYPDTEIDWVVLSAPADRRSEAEHSAAALCKPARLRTVFADFRDGYFPWQGEQIKDTFESLKTELDPDLIFTHYRDDRHQDHRVVSDLTWNSFRDHLILEYEVPKYDGDLGTPNVFVALPAVQAERKVRHVLEHFPSQRARSWFDEATLRAMLRLRGLECKAPERFAEGFHGRKLVISHPG